MAALIAAGVAVTAALIFGKVVFIAALINLKWSSACDNTSVLVGLLVFKSLIKVISYRSTIALSLSNHKLCKQIIVSSFPRSGSTFISDFLSKYFDLPCPRKYHHPLLIDSVLHSHIGYIKSSRPRVYIYRNPIKCFISYFVKTNIFKEDTFSNDFGTEEHCFSH